MVIAADQYDNGVDPSGRPVPAFTFTGPIVCRTINEGADGTVSLHGLFDVVTAARLPSELPELGVYAELVGRPPPGPALMHVLAPGGWVVCTAGGVLECHPAVPRAHRLHHTWRRVPLAGPGVYRVQVAFAGRLVGERVFRVSLSHEPAASATEPEPATDAGAVRGRGCRR